MRDHKIAILQEGIHGICVILRVNSMSSRVYTLFWDFYMCKSACVIRIINIMLSALAGLVQWVGHHPAIQRVTGMIPGQGTCLGCGPCSQLGTCERQPINVSFPSKNK